MICAKTVLPRYTRYSESKARSVHQSTFAIQVGDTPDGAANPMNKRLQPDAYSFNRTLVRFRPIAPVQWYFQ